MFACFLLFHTWLYNDLINLILYQNKCQYLSWCAKTGAIQMSNMCRKWCHNILWMCQNTCQMMWEWCQNRCQAVTRWCQKWCYGTSFSPVLALIWIHLVCKSCVFGIWFASIWHNIKCPNVDFSSNFKANAPWLALVLVFWLGACRTHHFNEGQCLRSRVSWQMSMLISGLVGMGEESVHPKPMCLYVLWFLPLIPFPSIHPERTNPKL